MRILPVNSYNTQQNNTFGKINVSETVEKVAATISTKDKLSRKTMPIELHNALTKLTAYRSFLLAAALFGFTGYQFGDKKADRENQDFANAIEVASIDSTKSFKVGDYTHDGNADIMVETTDGKTLILDIKNNSIYSDNSNSSGFKRVE